MVGGVGEFSSGWAKMSLLEGAGLNSGQCQRAVTWCSSQGRHLLGYACGVTGGLLSCEHPFALCDRDEADQ